ncbi:MATE family efflux transporter [Aristophania vespae]|uniref:MATE family efflux transporter n=1 Tax=Aristophania vespae TaxID=2697033 RepID=UPI0023518B84|nr:MATE family efflux transporter [Aristophania vespae]UMM64023.1 lipid II flippase MurJ [Aristophania vespae]
MDNHPSSDPDDKKKLSHSPQPLIKDRPLNRARFVHGSIMRHVLTMAITGAVGLMAVFAVDLLNFFYISHLHDPTLTAAIAFASSLSFVQTAVGLGMAIGLGACIGRLIGARQHDRARELASSFLVVMIIVTLALGLFTAIFAHYFLTLLGAKGEALIHATRFLHIISPALPLICLGMTLSALLRAVGDAKRSMRVTLIGAVFTAILDPILIFGFNLGLEGAAISTVLSRCAISVSGFLNLRGHAMIERPKLNLIMPATREIGNIALPAIGTNLATPVGALFATHAMSRFGLEAVSGQAVVDRLVPVSFAFVFALTGSVGPIMAQNLGAGQFHRVREAFTCSLKLTALCVAIAWVVFASCHTVILKLFHVQGAGIELVNLFCFGVVASYMFVGLLFVSNTAFNNLGHPLYSTAFNWGRATLGTIPFVTIGAYYGPKGVMIGQALGVVIFGSLAMMAALSVIHNLEKTASHKIPTPSAKNQL